MRLARASCCCCQYLFGTRSSNHCENLLRWSCSLLSNSLITCGAQCAGNQIIRESAGQKPPIQSETHAVFTTGARLLGCLCLAIILTSPLQGRFLSPSTLALGQMPQAANLDKWVEPSNSHQEDECSAHQSGEHLEMCGQQGESRLQIQPNSLLRVRLLTACRSAPNESSGTAW